MAGPTKTDQIWLQVLDRIRVRGKVRRNDITVDVSDTAILNHFRTMEENGLLARTDQSGDWFAGPAAVRTLNLTEKAQQNAVTNEDEMIDPSSQNIK